MAVEERSLSYQDAVKEGLAFSFKSVQPGQWIPAEFYYKRALGGTTAANQIIKNNEIRGESFWQAAFNDPMVQKYAPKPTTANLQKQTTAIQEKTGREVGAQRATTKRAARAAGGMLSGAKSPAMGASSSGPMLGGDSMLGEESMLGSRRRM
jgi:hypothetical protein